MSTFTAILKAGDDGNVQFSLPPEMRHGKVKVVATMAGESDNDEDREARIRQKVEAVKEWARTSRGVVKLLPGETADDVRMAYYTQKYGKLP